jgi:hypothetical protein
LLKGAFKMNLKNIKIVYAIYILISLIIGMWGGYKIAKGEEIVRELLLMINLLGVLSCVLGFPLALSWWRKIDEASREAHKIAWFFGGSIGILIAMILVVLNLMFDGIILNGLAAGIKGAENYSFEIGVTTCLTLAGLGYMINWAIWWKKHGA